MSTSQLRGLAGLDATNGDHLNLVWLVLTQFSIRSCDNEEVIELAPVQNDYTLLVRKVPEKIYHYNIVNATQCNSPNADKNI